MRSGPKAIGKKVPADISRVSKAGAGNDMKTGIIGRGTGRRFVPEGEDRYFPAGFSGEVIGRKSTFGFSTGFSFSRMKL